MARTLESYHDAVTLLRICWRRRWFVLAVALCATAATYVVLLFKKPVYEATAYLLASGARSSRVIKQPESLLLSDLLKVTESRSTRTLSALLGSESLLHEARDSLRPEHAREFPDAWDMPVRVQDITGTEIVAVNVRSASKDAAVAMADAITVTATKLSGRINEAATQEGGESLEVELVRTRSKVDAAHARLQSLREEHGVSDLSAESEGVVLQLMNAQEQRTRDQVRLDAVRGSIAQSREQLKQEPALVYTGGTSFRSPVLDRSSAPNDAGPGDGGQQSSPEPSPARDPDGGSASALLKSATEGPNPLRNALLLRISALESQEASLVAEIGALDRATRSLEERLQRLGEIEGSWDRATNTYTVLQDSYAVLLANQEEIETRRKARLEDVQILAPARLKPYPVSPRRVLDLAAALVLGTLAGAVGAVVGHVYRGGPSRGAAGEAPPAAASLGK